MRHLLILLSLAIPFLAADDAEARRHRGRRGVSVSVSAGTHHRVEIDVKCQALALKRATAMARLRILSHAIHTYRDANCPSWTACRATGEGIGYGGREKCGTCIAGSTCVGDASVKSKNGNWYRVRLWR